MGTPRGLPLLGGGQDRGLAYPSPVASRSCRRQALHETSRAFLEAGPHPQQLAAALATRLADLIGGGCDALIPANPPPEALHAKRERANQELRGDHVHTVPNKAKTRGYRPGRKQAKRRERR